MLSQFCIKRPIFASVLSILIVIAGLLAGYFLPISQYPEITPPTIFVTATYEGADSQTLAKTVATPIEDQLSGIDSLSYYQTSVRSNGEVRINCTFEVGTNPNDAMLEINNRVRSAETKLPETVRKNGVTVRKRSEETLLMIPFFAPKGDLSAPQLADFLNQNIVDEIKRVSGVGDVGVYGTAQSAMRIWLNPRKMAQLGITVGDVESAITEQNKQYAAGKIGTAPSRDDQQLYYTVRTRGQLLTPDQFGEIIIRAKGADGIVRLKDIARIEVGSRSYDAYNRLNQYPSVTFAIYLQSGANSLATANRVKAKLTELEKKIPENISYVITDDNSQFVNIALQKVLRTLLEAVVLVLIVVYIFLQNARATLIPMLAVPVSLIGTFAGLWILGFSINTLTLFAMTLAIGIVVDDAIVVLENVQRIMDKEKCSAFDAAQKAMKEVGSALVAIVLVLTSVFTPVAFLGGLAGTLYKQFAATIGISVVISGFVALTLSPALCSILLKPKEKSNAFFTRFNSGFDKFRDASVSIVNWLLGHSFVALLSLIACILASWLFLKIIPTSFVPVEDQGMLRMSVQLPEGSALAKTGKLVRKLIEDIRKIPEIENVTALVANDTVANDSRPNAASLSVQLRHWDERERDANAVLADLRKIAGRLDTAVAQAMQPPAVRGLGRSGGAEVFIQSTGSDDPKALEEVSRQFVSELLGTPEVASARSILQASSPQIYISVDEAKALSLGVTVSDIYSTLSSFMGGKYVNDFNRIGKTYRVIIQADSAFRGSPESLGELYVRSSLGKMIPISALTTVTRISGPESLTKMNGILASSINIQGAAGISSGKLIERIEEIADETLPDGYQIAWSGQIYQEKKIGNSSTIAITFGIIVVFLLLAAQFEKWSLPLAVIMAIPYALLGAVVAVYLRGFANDIYFQIGLLVLIGLAAKNAILIVEFAEQKLEEGFGLKEAAAEAVRLRLRPIVMTSLAFILGVVPLITAHGAGAAARQSMGTGVFGGMLAVTFIATFFIPVFFTWFASVKSARRR
jgi:hydrophobe/amphiphile efflux-1 (HAE1) family protein